MLAITFSFTNLAAAPLEKVNASYGAISGSILPIWVAKEARLFEKHGLDLNLGSISGGPPPHRVVDWRQLTTLKLLRDWIEGIIYLKAKAGVPFSASSKIGRNSG